MPVSAFTAGDVLTAANMNLLPRGEMGYAQRTTDQGGITTVTDVTSLSVTWTAVSSRRYKITAQAGLLSSVLDDVASIWITDAANAKQATAYVLVRTVSFGVQTNTSKIVTGLSGSTTWKVRAERIAGTGSISVVSGATFPSFILVEDIGAA